MGRGSGKASQSASVMTQSPGTAWHGSPIIRQSRSVFSPPVVQAKVNHPAPPSVRSGTTAVGEYRRIGATGFLQGVCQNRQALEGPVLIDRLGQPRDSASTPGKPLRINDRRAERVAED